MKNNYLPISFSLLLSLFIYLVYRTENTVINEICISIISFEKFIGLRSIISETMPLNEHIIYSLPEGLWVFCITLTSKFFFVRIGSRELKLIFVPLIFSIGLELFQLIHFTNGRFDLWDMAAAVMFWAIANYLIPFKQTRKNILGPVTTRSAICLFSYLIVYLAHVWNN